MSDILQAADSSNVILLGLLDMSAAFGIVDHAILLDCLHMSFGVSGTVLSWIESFITARTKAVYISEDQSTTSAVICGVPQGSVLGPLQFLLHTANVLKIVQYHGLLGHSCANDTSIYLHADASQCTAQLSVMCHSVHRRHKEVDVTKSSQTKCRQDPVYLARYCTTTGKGK